MGKALRGEEEWVRRQMSAALGVPVEQHDDGSSPGMHDLTILYNDRPHAAVEIKAAADGEMIAFYRRMKEGRWIDPDLAGGWSVHVHASNRVLTAHSAV